MPPNMDRLEIERVENLIKNFGWSKAKEELTDDKIILTFEKPRENIPDETGEGSD